MSRWRRNGYARKRVALFGTETALCAVMIEKAREAGLKAYPETSGFDLVVVDERSGEQAGIQAKLRPNVDVLAQAMNPREDRPGPAVHAVLVPSSSDAFDAVARKLGITVIDGWRLIPEQLPANTWGGAAPPLDPREALFFRTHRWEHPEPCWVPEVEVDVAAGVSGPKTVTPWKMKAVKLSLELHDGLELTRKEIEARGMSAVIWIDRWLEPTGVKRDRHQIYRMKPGVVLPSDLYPAICEALSGRSSPRPD